MAQLQNIKAIRQMLDGTHKTQSKTQVLIGDTRKTQTREIGEIWTDDNGVLWEQRDGFVIKKGKLDELRELLNSMKVPSNCPKCGKQMSHRFDKKFWELEGHCFDCQIAYEHQLRIDGKYEEYENDRIRKNAEAWLKDAEQEASTIIDAFRNPQTFVDTDGSIESWSGGRTAEEVADIIDAEFKAFKEGFLKSLEKPDDSIDE